MGSGHLRTLGFVRNLPALGWEPVVLSANAAAYPRVDAANNKLIPDHCCVHRAFALDARRHLGIAGKYPAFLAQPDRWAGWWPAAVWQGLRLIRRHRISAIWSTYPIMTAHGIAHSLSRITGLPWIADFRDPVASSVEAGNRFTIASQKRWEQRVLARATRVVFTTPGALRGHAERFPRVAESGHMAVIPNGYDETSFPEVRMDSHPVPRRRLRLVHSGVLYPEGRNPVPFFDALARLKAADRLTDDDIEIVLRASGSEATYAEEIRRRDLGNMVTLAPPISNQEALHEQGEADALLLFQGTRYDRQIPAKVYEYLRIGRPIFALVGEGGDTAELLRDTGGAVLVPVDNVAAIERGLADFVQALRDGRAPAADERIVRSYSRYEGAASLARLLDEVTA